VDPDVTADELWTIFKEYGAVSIPSPTLDDCGKDDQDLDQSLWILTYCLLLGSCSVNIRFSSVQTATYVKHKLNNMEISGRILRIDWMRNGFQAVSDYASGRQDLSSEFGDADNDTLSADGALATETDKHPANNSKRAVESRNTTSCSEADSEGYAGRLDSAEPSNARVSPVVSVYVQFESISPSARISESGMKLVFEPFGKVVGCYIKSSYLSKDGNREFGYGFVHFECSAAGHEAAKRAVSTIGNGTDNSPHFIQNGIVYRCEVSNNLRRAAAILRDKGDGSRVDADSRGGSTTKRPGKDRQAVQYMYPQTLAAQNMYPAANQAPFLYSPDDYNRYNGAPAYTGYPVMCSPYYPVMTSPVVYSSPVYWDTTGVDHSQYDASGHGGSIHSPMMNRGHVEHSAYGNVRAPSHNVQSLAYAVPQQQPVANGTVTSPQLYYAHNGLLVNCVPTANFDAAGNNGYPTVQPFAQPLQQHYQHVPAASAADAAGYHYPPSHPSGMQFGNQTGSASVGGHHYYEPTTATHSRGMQHLPCDLTSPISPSMLGHEFGRMRLAGTVGTN
jgi:RNA recognition motif-containing protein